MHRLDRMQPAHGCAAISDRRDQCGGQCGGVGRRDAHVISRWCGGGVRSRPVPIMRMQTRRKLPPALSIVWIRYASGTRFRCRSSALSSQHSTSKTRTRHSTSSRSSIRSRPQRRHCSHRRCLFHPRMPCENASLLVAGDNDRSPNNQFWSNNQFSCCSASRQSSLRSSTTLQSR